MAGFFNTITSPDEQAVADSGNDQPPPGDAAPQQPRTLKALRPEDMPMGRIMAAVMRANAKVQGQEQAKKVAASQAEGNAKLKVTMTANPAGGPPNIDIKNATPDLLNGTQAQDITQAYTQPQQQVEKKLGNAPQASAAPQTAPMTQPAADHPLEQAAAALEANGIPVIRPWGDEIKNATSSEQALIDVGKRLGVPNAEQNAHDAWKRMKAGKLKPEVVQRNLANIAAGQLEQKSHNLQATLAPYAEEKQRQQTEADRKATQARLERSLSDAEQQRIQSRKKDIVEKTDWSTIDPSELQSTVEGMNDTGVPFSDFELARVRQKQKQDVGKAFVDFIGNKEKYALGDYPSWEEAKTAFGHPISPTQDKQGFAAWDAAHKFAQRKAADDSAQQELRAARLEVIHLRIQNANTEKPVPIGRGDLALMPADELVAADPAKVKNYDSALEQKEGLLTKELADHQDKFQKAHAQQVAIQNKPANQKQFGDEEQLAGYRADAAAAKRRMDEATRELRLVQAKRAERRGAPIQAPAAVVPPVQVGPKKSKETAPAPPKVGDKKTFTAGPYAGKTGTWNGSAYEIR